MTRNTDENDYIMVPFPKVNGETHPALARLAKEGSLLSLVSELGFKKSGMGPFIAAMIIARDMERHPYDPAYATIMVPDKPIWYPNGMVSAGAGQYQAPEPEEPELTEDEVAAQRKAKALSRFGDDDDDDDDDE